MSERTPAHRRLPSGSAPMPNGSAPMPNGGAPMKEPPP